MAENWREKGALWRVGVGNAFWLMWRFWVEMIFYGYRRWWWQVRCALWWGWLDTSPIALVRAAQGRYQRDEDLIYGETLPGTAYEIFRYIGITERDVIVDLGCGRGVISLVAGLAFGAKSCGIDLLRGYIERGERLVRALKLLGVVSFRPGDLLKCDIPKGSVYFFAGTCLSQENWRKVVRRFTAVAPKGAWAISLSQALPTEDWELVSEDKMPFSWGYATVYIHRRTDTPGKVRQCSNAGEN